jgi:nucleoside-diphosphate-sugar epimerase
MRLDLSVNILTNHAVTNRKIMVFGGNQLRPNLHIQDMVDLYKLLLTVPAEKIQGETFNVSCCNMSIMDIANTAKKVVEELVPGAPIELEVSESNDPRSYHVNADKITRLLGFKPKYTVEDAIRDVAKALVAGKLPNSMTDESYFNVRTMKSKNAA